MRTPISRDSTNPFPINSEMAGLVPMASDAEQASLTADISMNGLREPIVLWRGEIIDGRCRQLACEATGQRIWAKEIDADTPEKNVQILVKSLNTRRNLTATQKTISACKDSLKPGSDSVIKIAQAWGISKNLLNNARYIAKHKPEFIEPLFNGGAIDIIGANGLEATSNKVSAIYAYLKKENENVINDTTYGWKEDSFIITQAGKEWYYEQVKDAEKIGPLKYKMLIAEFANMKHETREEAMKRFDVQDYAKGK